MGSGAPLQTYFLDVVETHKKKIEVTVMEEKSLNTLRRKIAYYEKWFAHYEGETDFMIVIPFKSRKGIAYIKAYAFARYIKKRRNTENVTIMTDCYDMGYSSVMQTLDQIIFMEDIPKKEKDFIINKVFMNNKSCFNAVELY